MEKTNPVFEKLRAIFQDTVTKHHQAYLENEGEIPSGRCGTRITSWLTSARC